MPGEPYEPSWQDSAACAGKPADWWFPERGDSLEPARAICRTCPVEEPCLEYALANHITHGLWGGKSERERRVLRRRRAALRVVPDKRICTERGCDNEAEPGRKICGPCRGHRQYLNRQAPDIGGAA